MKKLLLQATVTVFLFLATYFMLRQFNWVQLFKVQETTDKTEEKLGEIFWDFFKRAEDPITDPEVVAAVDSIVSRLCVANQIDRDFIKVHLLKNDEINAFALPNGHLVVYSGLILFAEDASALAGVLGHEIAHIERKHVMKKLVKEIGLSVLISMTTGSGGEILKESAKVLSSTAFDRSLEKEADMQAVDYLIKAKIDPAPFADFLYNISYEFPAELAYLTWMSTHPEAKARAEYILEYAKGKESDFTSPLQQEEWDKVKAILED